VQDGAVRRRPPGLPWLLDEVASGERQVRP
jgi:hypothetical protein